MDLIPASAPRGVLSSVSAVIAGGLSAALFAVALMHPGTAMFLLAYIASIPLFLAGLSIGSVAGLIASSTGFIGLYLGSPSGFTISYATLNAIPAMLLIVLALRHRTGSDEKIYWYPEGFLMIALALYPCIIFLALSGMTSDQGGLLALTTDSLNQLMDLFKDKMSKDKVDAADLLQFTSMVDYLARLLPALAGCAWMMITMICVICAQNILVQHKWNLRPSFSLQALHIPVWMIFAVAIAGLLAEYAPDPYNYYSVNLAIMLGMPFFFVGLAIVHAWAATFKSQRAQKIVLILFYVLASLLIWSTLLIAALGVIDQWVNFRQRFAVRPKTNMS